jgi:hypothetical protein|tara:strand:+ start:456 stop:569 length:114 start_codon:yes stop_codon:yes gene_type:complete
MSVALRRKVAPVFNAYLNSMFVSLIAARAECPRLLML